LAVFETRAFAGWAVGSLHLTGAWTVISLLVLPRRSVMATRNSNCTMLARLKTVDEHVRLENEHSLDGIMETFGETARYDDEPWGAHYMGREEVREFYTQLLRAMPDLHIDVRQRHVAEDAIILEVIIRGRHLGTWRGLPATGRQISFSLCGIYTFNEWNQLAGEKIYYDRATVLRQLGVFYEPESLRGRIITVLTHPFTMVRIVTRKAPWGARSAASRKTTPL
jgi:steroid delta-isomerase-like uncharacterized protein